MTPEAVTILLARTWLLKECATGAAGMVAQTWQIFSGPQSLERASRRG